MPAIRSNPPEPPEDPAMTIKKSLGAFLVSLPFLIVTALFLATAGPLLTLALYGIVAAIIACIVGGVALMDS